MYSACSVAYRKYLVERERWRWLLAKGTNGTELDIREAVLYYKDIYARGYYRSELG